MTSSSSSPSSSSLSLPSPSPSQRQQPQPFPSWSLRLYRFLLTAVSPGLAVYTWQRSENVAFWERWGVYETSFAPSNTPLVWFHGASVGETVSVLPLVKRLLHRFPHLHVLITTGTQTATQVLAKCLPPRTIVHFAPMDMLGNVERFLKHWHPCAAIWIESELWPNMIASTWSSHIPLALVNGRMSDRSFQRWSHFLAQPLVKQMLSCFDWVLAGSREDQHKLGTLGAENVSYVGNLKEAADSLSVKHDVVRVLRDQIGVRPVWVAASTHPMEETFVLDATLLLRKEYPDLLTIIVPRHVSRAYDVEKLVVERGLRVLRRSTESRDNVTRVIRDTDVWIVDAMGELGTVFSLTKIVLVGGSLLPGMGGHNILEPLHFGCVVLTGPFTSSFAAILEDIHAIHADVVKTVHNPPEMVALVRSLFLDEFFLQQQCELGCDVIKHVGTSVLDKTCTLVIPWLERALLEQADQPNNGLSSTLID